MCTWTTTDELWFLGGWERIHTSVTGWHSLQCHDTCASPTLNHPQLGLCLSHPDDAIIYITGKYMQCTCTTNCWFLTYGVHMGRKFILLMWALHLIHVHPPSGASPARIVPESLSDEPELQWYMPLWLQLWIIGLQNPAYLVQIFPTIALLFWRLKGFLSCGVLEWTGLCSKTRNLFYRHFISINVLRVSYRCF